MKTITASQQLSDKEVDNLLGKFVDESHIKHLSVGENVTVLKPDGSVLLKYIPNAIPLEDVKATRQFWREAANQTG